MKAMIGSWAFIIGVLLAVIVGAVNGVTDKPVDPTVGVILVIIGLVVGIINVTDKEVTPFLMAGVVIIIAANFGQSQLDQVKIVTSILKSVMYMIVPATVIVALKSVFAIAKDQ